MAGIILSFARLAEGRRSASEAISYSSRITKIHISSAIGLLGMCVIYYSFVGLISYSVYLLANTFSDYGISDQVEIILDLLLSLPLAFANVLTITSFALLYLRLRK